MKLSTRKHIKLAAQWAAFFVLAVALVVTASIIGAELAGASSQEGWALAKLASLVVAALSLLGYVVQQIEG